MTTGLPGQPVSTAPLPQLTSEPAKLFQTCIHCYLLHIVPTIPKPKKDRRSTPASHHRPHGQPRPRQLQPTKPPSAPSTSDSEVSDGEVQDSVITKALSSRLRHQALVCLTSVFTVSTYVLIHTQPPSLLACCRPLVPGPLSLTGSHFCRMVHVCHTHLPLYSLVSLEITTTRQDQFR